MKEMIKHGMLTEDSTSDFSSKKAKYFDEHSHLVADEDNKAKLTKPVKIKADNE